MVPVFFLFLCLISSALMEDVIHKNFTRKSTELKPVKSLPSNLQHLYNIRNEKPTPQANSKVNIEEPQTSKCPNTDILLKILNLLTKSLPKTLLQPQKFKDIISTIKIILSKASVNNDVHDDLHNEIKILEDQLEKISKADEEKVVLRKQGDKNLKAKLSLQYDIPDKCEHILYALVSFINNAYNQVAKYCLVTGNCKVDDLPRIKYDTSGQIQQPFNLDGLLQKTPDSNPYLQSSDTQNTNPKYDGVYDVIKALQNYEANLGSDSTSVQNYLNSLIPHNENINSNNLLYNVPNKSLNGLLGLYPEWMLPDYRTEQSSNNKLPLQDFYSALKNLPPNANDNQDYMKILTEKLKTIVNPNNSKQNTEDASNSDVLTLLQPLGINVLSPSKIDKPKPPLNDRGSDAINRQTNTPKQADKHASYDTNLKNSDQLNINDIYQLLYSIKSQTDQTGNKLLDAYSGSYVTPDTLNITPDKNKQYNELPDLSQFGVTNQDKLNTIPNQNEVVELTYMLKRPKLAYEPLYYVKYSIPYYIFLYNLQKLLIKNPYLRNYPRKLYQELLMHSNITEAPGDLKNLEHEELVKLIATNGTLLNAKIVTLSKTEDKLLDEAQNSTSNVVNEANKTKDDPLSIIQKLVNLANNDTSERHFNQRIGSNSYLSYGYPSKSKSLYQSGLNYNPGNLLSSSSSSYVYGRPSVYGYSSVNKNVLPSNIPLYSMYASGYPQAG